MPVRDFWEISLHYLKGEFIYDAIALFPFPNILYRYEALNRRAHWKLFYIIKQIRFKEFFKNTTKSSEIFRHTIATHLDFKRDDVEMEQLDFNYGINRQNVC